MPLHLPEKCFTPNEIKTAIQKYSTKKHRVLILLLQELLDVFRKKLSYSLPIYLMQPYGFHTSHSYGNFQT